MCYVLFFFFFKQKTAYVIRIMDWSSDVCSSDLRSKQGFVQLIPGELAPMEFGRIVDGIVDKGIKADTKAGKTIWEVERLPEEPVLGIGDDLAIYTPKNTPVSHLSMHDAIQYYRLARHVTDRLAKGPKVITLQAKTTIGKAAGREKE